MEEITKTRLFRYLMYTLTFIVMNMLIGFEVTMFMIGAFILVDIEDINKK